MAITPSQIVNNRTKKIETIVLSEEERIDALLEHNYDPTSHGSVEVTPTQEDPAWPAGFATEVTSRVLAIYSPYWYVEGKEGTWQFRHKSDPR